MYKYLFLICSIFSFGSNLLAMKKTVEAAGVLPFCVHKGKGLILIGKQNSYNGPLVWCDFGGFRDKPDQTIEYAAAREFSEETRYVFGRLINDYSLEGSINYILPRIKSDWFLKKTSQDRKGKKIDYTMYLVEVDYISAEILKNAKKVPHYEKEDYCWVPADDFLNYFVSTNKSADVFKEKNMRRVFADNLKSHSDDLKKLLLVIQNTSSKEKIKLPEQPGPDAAKGVAALCAAITAPKVAIAAVAMSVGYWVYTKYQAYKTAQTEKQTQESAAVKATTDRQAKAENKQRAYKQSARKQRVR